MVITLTTETNRTDPPSSLPGHPLVWRLMVEARHPCKRNMFKVWIRAFFLFGRAVPKPCNRVLGESPQK